MEGIINKEALLKLINNIKEKAKTIDKKYIAIAFVIILLIFVVIAVLPSGVSEDEIKNQITLFEEFEYYSNPFEITEYTEYRRDTDRENKYDNIWVAIVAENDYVKYEASYFLSFTLYNDGWELRTIEYTNDYIAYESQSYSAKDDISEEKIIADLTEQFNELVTEYNLYNIQIDAQIPQEQSQLISLNIPCTIAAENDIMFINGEVIVSYECNMDSGWICNSIEENDYSYEAKNEPPQEIINAAFENLAGEYTIDSYEKIDQNSYVYYYTQYDDETYDGLTVTRKGGWGFVFDIFTLDSNYWRAANRDSEIVQIDMNLNGEYSYKNDKEYFYLTVENASQTEISYNFDLSFYETHVWGNEQNCQLSTEGETRTKEWIYEYDSENSCIIFKTTKSIFSIAWCGGLSDKDYYLEYRAYAVETEENVSGFYVDDRLITKV